MGVLYFIWKPCCQQFFQLSDHELRKYIIIDFSLKKTKVYKNVKLNIYIKCYLLYQMWKKCKLTTELVILSKF